MKPLVSIIIPLYNSEKYIGETLRSALAQTWPHKEIIVIDDASTDRSLSIARQFESNEVKVFSKANGGASVARNFGLEQSKGEYVQFLDADDLLSNNKIQSQMEAMAPYPNHVGLCGTIHFKDGTNHLDYALTHEWIAEGSDDPADFLTKLYGGDLIGPQYGGMIQTNSWLTPRHIIEKAGHWNPSKSPDDDGEFFCRVLLASEGIKYSFEGINYYRKFDAAKTWSAKKTYEASLAILQGTDLKTQHLLKATDNSKAKLALSRLYLESAFNFYPVHPALSYQAEQKAKALGPALKYSFYKNGAAYQLSKILGWKTVRYLQYLKSALFSNGTNNK